MFLPNISNGWWELGLKFLDFYYLQISVLSVLPKGKNIVGNWRHMDFYYPNKPFYLLDFYYPSFSRTYT
jgi:hypothetical protein